MSQIFPGPRSRFVEIRCEDCGNNQVIFNKPSTEVRCLVCNAELAEPSGGGAKFYGTILGVVG